MIFVHYNTFEKEVIMLKGFIKFEDKGKHFSLLVSISPTTGRIAFNDASVRELGLSDYLWAVLLYNANTEQIAVKMLKTEDEKGAIKLQFRKGSGLYIPAAKFMEKFEIKLLVPTFFEPVRCDDMSNIFIIDLKAPLKRKGGSGVK